jgi:ABC-type glycerol-3-phosphate transport system substrate-binding protein
MADEADVSYLASTDRRAGSKTLSRRVPAVVALVCLVALLTTGCELRRKRVLVWHDWPEPEAEVLVELLNGYSELDPDLRLIIEYVPAEEIESRFVDEARSGFGPDVLIGVDADRLADLASVDVVQAISDEQSNRYGFDQLEARALEAMAIDGIQEGIPLAGSTDVLFYRDGITPPATLDAIVGLAEDGYSTGIPVDFVGAYWGVDAFGGTAFGGDGTLDPDQGFVDWMTWLVEARPQPNIVLDGDYRSLRDLFAAGRLDLFIGGSRELGLFRSALSETETEPTSSSVAPLPDVADVDFGLTTLPSVDEQLSGGFLEIEGMVVNRHTDNLDESLALIEYLTNVPSQGRIARSGLGRIPINEAVSIDPSISPMEAALVRQQSRSVILPRAFEENLAELRELGDEVYLQVARGLLEPDGAATELRERYAEIVAASND